MLLHSALNNDPPVSVCDLRLTSTAIHFGAGVSMAESDAEGHNGAPQGSPGPISPAVDAALFLSVWSARGLRATVVLNTSVVPVCTLLCCRCIVPIVVLHPHTTEPQCSAMDARPHVRTSASPRVHLFVPIDITSCRMK